MTGASLHWGARCAPELPTLSGAAAIWLWWRGCGYCCCFLSSVSGSVMVSCHLRMSALCCPGLECTVSLDHPIEHPYATKDWRFGLYKQPDLLTVIQRTKLVLNCWRTDLLALAHTLASSFS